MISQSFKMFCMIKQFSSSHYRSAVTHISSSFLYLWIIQNLTGSIAKRASENCFQLKILPFLASHPLTNKLQAAVPFKLPKYLFLVKNKLFDCFLLLFVCFICFVIGIISFTLSSFEFCVPDMFLLRITSVSILSESLGSSLTIICQFFLNNLSHLAKHFKDWQLEFI